MGCRLAAVSEACSLILSGEAPARARLQLQASMNPYTEPDWHVQGFEIVKAVHLDPVQFSVEQDLLTPTFKLKRPQLQKHYQSTIDAMYTKVNSK